MRRPPVHIVLATDFSARCDRAQDRAVQLALDWDAGLTVVHALDQIGLTDDPDLQAAARAAAAREAALLREELAAIQGLRATVAVEEGSAIEVVGSIARRDRAGLVVTGIAGRGSFGRPRVGSTVSLLARTSPLPLLVVERKPLQGVGHAVLATDLSGAGDPVVEAAVHWFRPRRLTIFHALPAERAGPDSRTAAEQACRTVLDRIAGQHGVPKSDILIDEGDPLPGLQVLAGERDVDLVIAGPPGRPHFSQVLPGSIATRIVEEVPCDVFVARHSPR